MLNAEKLQAHWDSIKGNLQEKWGQLTNDDLATFNGQTDQLVATIERKTGAAREYIEEVLNDFSDESSSFLQRAAETAQGFASNTAQAVSTAATKVASGVATGVRSGVETAEHTIHDYPGRSVAVAFGSGMLMGLLVGLCINMRD